MIEISLAQKVTEEGLPMCNCIEKTNKSLKEHPEWNTTLDIPFTWDKKGALSADKVTISTMKADDRNRQKPIRLFASYCPFCGEKYKEKDDHPSDLR
jgi:hypothetical protein